MRARHRGSGTNYFNMKLYGEPLFWRPELQRRRIYYSMRRRGLRSAQSQHPDVDCGLYSVLTILITSITRNHLRPDRSRDVLSFYATQNDCSASSSGLRV